MRHTSLYVIALTAVLVLTLLGSTISLAGPPGQGQVQPAPIKLQTATFVPARGESPPIPPGLTISGYAQGQTGYYIVQFQGPVQAAWKDQVAAQGAELLDYIPNFAFKVRMNPAQAARVQSLESVAWVGLFQPAYKLSPDLNLEGTNLYRVRVERGADAGQATAAIAQSGAQIMRRDNNILLVAADATQIEAIAQVLDVAWLENYAPKQKHNEYGAGVILGANTAHTNGYDGSTQIAAVADSGLGDGTAAGAHPDIPASRIVSIYNWPGQTDTCFQQIIDDGAQDVETGHGTHTAVSVVGDGDANGEGKGVAPAAGLVFQATENWANISNFCQMFGGWPPNGYFLTGLPDDLRQLFQQAYNAGARIHSNSWGAALNGDYTLDSANTDNFIWTNPDMTITFSAGNEGTDANANGLVDSDSIGSPATAKNVITVGASENDRGGDYQCDTNLTYTSHDNYQPGQTCASMGGNNLGYLGTYGERWGADFPADPIASDVTAGNIEQMAAFSSRGPTDDGRIKPDVVAPGTWILSGFSTMYQEGYGDPLNPQNNEYQWDGWGMPRNEFYKYMGGTSMSNPLGAGSATVVRDFYQKAYGHAASAALVKATLINSAVDMLDENNDGANDNDYPIPNDHEGWGRIDLAAATDGGHQYADDTAGVGTGGSDGYQYSIGTGGAPFKVSLVWSDYPSTEAAAANLVNDLDLVVTAPDGTTTYSGNNFSNGWSQPGGGADRVNNVENVYVQSAAAGTWTVEVIGFNVPQGTNQPYALVVDGQFGVGPTPTPTDTPTATPTPTDTPIPGTELHVASIDMAVVKAGGANNLAQATVTILDNNGLPVEGASVTGTFSGDSSGTDSGLTGANGQVILQSSPVKRGANWTFCVDDVSKSGYTYDPAANVETCDSTGTPPTNTPTPGPTNTPTPIPTPGGAIVHVGDLDGSSVAAPRSRWNATVTITVHDAGENPVANATVDGSWSNGANGGASCVTNGEGRCNASKSNIRGDVASVTFTVDNVTHASYTYDPGANHDPDGDSDGTSITVLQP